MSESAVYPLRDPREAFAARIHLARMARHTLDAQYYIWRNDTTGTLVFQAMLEAANRGVRVRLLLDDNNTAGLDPILAALDAHPNIEVRLFNPFTLRWPRWLGYVTDFSRVNHRMHNKSFTADGEVTIVGGRNIGDEYFGASTSGITFTDLDVMVRGPAVAAVSDDFERYWNSESACQIGRLVPRAKPADVASLPARFTSVERNPASQRYVEAIGQMSFVREMAERTLPIDCVPVRMISDDPDKVLGRAARKSLLIEKIRTIFGEPAIRIDLVSPYFVVGATGTDVLGQWRRRGVLVNVLTNALEATDVAAVHSGYAKRRKAMLEAGITLYELRRTARLPEHRSGPAGRSTSGLHAKTFQVDGRRVFVGSFNFDPRSAHLNTEMGFVIDSPTLARQIEQTFATVVPVNAYETHLSERGKLFWIAREPDGRVARFDTEPGSTALRRTAVGIASHLPIEWLL